MAEMMGKADRPRRKRKPGFTPGQVPGKIRGREGKNPGKYMPYGPGNLPPKGR